LELLAILDGPLHQQLACWLATQLGFPSSIQLPKSVCALIVALLIEALIVVFRRGAPTTRGAAVEGLGVLLRLADGDLATALPAAQAEYNDRRERRLAKGWPGCWQRR
jgi:hypothetical protein